MQRTLQRQKSEYIVVPRTTWERGERRRVPKVSLQTLRKLVSKSWRGSGAIDEIRAQRKR